MAAPRWRLAIGYVRRIRSFCEGLEPFPERGVERDDIRPGLRLALFERRVVVAFTITPDQVRIGRICYGGRDYAALLGKDPLHALDSIMPFKACRYHGLGRTIGR